MGKNQDYQARAAEFLRHWQEQMTRQMTHPDAIRAMLEAMQQFGATAHDANPRRPAHAPDASDDAVRHLAKRLDAVERELASLHARVAAAEKPARAKPRRHGKSVEAGKRPVAKRKPVAKPKRAAKRKK